MVKNFEFYVLLFVAVLVVVLFWSRQTIKDFLEKITNNGSTDKPVIGKPKVDKYINVSDPRQKLPVQSQQIPTPTQPPIQTPIPSVENKPNIILKDIPILKKIF